MRELTLADCEKIDLESAKAEISNRVYAAAILFERLENAGKVCGNGHHMAQEVCTFAEELLVKRWHNLQEIPK
jgi:hypothetical protein